MSIPEMIKPYEEKIAKCIYDINWVHRKITKEYNLNKEQQKELILAIMDIKTIFD